MPDDQGKLSDEDFATLREWMERHWEGGARCFVCNSNDWTIGEHTVAPMVSSPQGDVGVANVLYPQVMLVCLSCGSTQYFNAALIGIVESRAKADARAEAEDDGSNGDE